MLRGFRFFALILAAFTGGLVAAGGVRAADDPDSTYRELAILARVLHYVETNFVAEVEPRALIHGAIRGMLATLDDHSTFMDPEQFAAIRSEAQGEFGGIGVELVRQKDRLVVVERYPGSPAERQGIQLGDVVISVGGQPTEGSSLAEVVRRIKGPPGTTVVLVVERAADHRVEELTVVRERIRMITVDGRWEGGFAYLKIKSFTERTSHDMARALEALKAERPIPGLILDLRDNPGGLLDEAVRVADIWLQSGVIVSTEGRNRPADVELAHPKDTEPEYPLVVLVNGGTASASEIVAGALQDHHRAVILGTQTFGKGSVQTVIELEDHSALKLTVARYFTPQHRSIQGTGITPDEVVPPVADPQGPLGADKQLDAAVILLTRWSKGQGKRLGTGTFR
ncbi:MAG: S41 family peptidase [Deltaproteobacteria bacterium]|nr:S41 family peptidase [Deltaproteobacteria bacterium]